MLKYVQWLEDDLGVVVRGIAGLSLLVIGGVVLAETSLNDLTRQVDFVQFVNLQMSKMGEYTFYFCGESFKLNALMEVGSITNTDRKLCVEIGAYTVTLNTMPVVDLRNVFHLLSPWIVSIKQGVLALVHDAGMWLMQMVS